jgi:hypothetical protein
MASKAQVARWNFAKHKWLALIGGISLLIWGCSGMTHVVMVLFGPQQNQFKPPVRALDLQGARPISQTLANAGISQAVAIRTVAGPQSSLLQVTTDPMQPRRYFDPRNGTELLGQDRVQAEFLARHYLNENRPIAAIALQRTFDADYPWVNRLLPVWRVQFAGDDRLTAYVHTETSSLAAVNNATKTGLQSAFRYLHTWEWVPASMDWLRVLVIGLMVGSLAALAITGAMMLVTIRRAKRLPGTKGWHRISGYVLALPLLMFSFSGIYHLVQSAIEPPTSHLRMAQPLDLSGQRFPITQQWTQVTAGLDVASLSLVEGENGRPLYRLGLTGPSGTGRMAEHDHSPNAGPANGPHAGHSMPGGVPTTAQEIRNARFDGVQPTGPAYYIDAATGKPTPLGDREVARIIANRYLGANNGQISDMALVTRFGVDYDFRNKRLPVWRVDYGSPYNASVFVDTATGTFVDRLDNWQKPERYVFSIVHKWNFLFPLGRTGLNAVVSGVVIALIIMMGVLGLQLYLKGRRAKRP